MSLIIKEVRFRLAFFDVNGPLLTVHLAKVALVVPRPTISILIGSVIVEITSIYVYTVIGLFLIHRSNIPQLVARVGATTGCRFSGVLL